MARILITGITGSVGSALAPRLIADGHEVRALVRTEPVALAAAGRPLPQEAVAVVGDLSTGAGLEEALDGIEVAYYLVHSMEPAGPDSSPFAVREAAAAENFARVARESGVTRTVYLGGLVPATAPISMHLASRLAVERVLLDAVPGSLAFRASIVIGSNSRSFRFLVRLIERMPMLVLPAWQEHRTAPVDQRDVIECLARAAGETPALDGRGSFDIGGPEVVTYGALIERIRDELMLGRPVFKLRGVTATPVASRVSAAIAGEAHELIGPLMEGLESDLLPREPGAPGLLGIRRHSLDAAIRRALGDWETAEPLRAR